MVKKNKRCAKTKKKTVKSAACAMYFKIVDFEDPAREENSSINSETVGERENIKM